MSGLPMSSSRREQKKQKLKENALRSVVNGGDPDDDTKRKAVMDVVQVWLDRLQLVSVITTFFASIDSTLLSFTTNLTHIDGLNPHQWSNTVLTMNATLVGALIFHVCAAVTSFVGSFVLIRYKLIDAKDHIPHTRTLNTPTSPIKPDISPRPDFSHLKSEPTTSSESHGSEHLSFAASPFAQAPHLLNLFSVWQTWSDTMSDMQGRIFIHQVRPFSCFREPAPGTALDPPVRLLSKCHSLSVTMAILGFILALVGILTFAWTSLPISVSVFASACLGACGTAIFIVLSFT